ncbi:MAG: hypothetical protein JWM16_4389 [Verrucomicrobiales bacterium]|nr:hypothetical protein [Verrucomicrobiales bacterium]
MISASCAVGMMLVATACSKSPKTFGSINEKMQHQAGVVAEKIKADSGLVLNYSIGSIKYLETPLNNLAGTIGKTDPAKASLEAETFGAYVGECLRKKLGGEWAEEQAEGKFVYRVKTPSGMAFTPATWCYERITGTEKQNIYKKVLAEAGAASAGK